MPDNLRPGALMMAGGGLILFISVFLDWVDFGGPFTASGTDTDFFGLTGIFMLLIAAVVVAIAAIGAFAPQVNLPANIVGFTMSQVLMIDSFAAFLTMFGLQFGSDRGIGVTLGWIGAAVMTAGAFMEDRATGPGTGGTPTPF